ALRPRDEGIAAAAGPRGAPGGPAPDLPPSGSVAAGAVGRGRIPLRSRSSRDTPRAGRRGIAFWLAVTWLVVVAVCAAAADWLPVADPVAPDVSARLDGPSVEHPLGADGLGRDQLARVVHAAQV